MNDRIAVIIPAFNEQDSVGRVIADIPDSLADQVIVVDNNSSDETHRVAAETGATVISQPRQGYGNACLKGIEHLRAQPENVRPDIVVFLDADYSDHPEDMTRLVQPIIQGDADFVIGSRNLGRRQKGAMLPQQVFGTWLATRLIRLLYRKRFTDLGPFRAIRFDKLMMLGMQDRTYGWTVEMQIKAIKKKVRFTEVPVQYRKRVGKSKISGTVRGTVGAGYKIITTIVKYA
jgi:glycosyltransferase involved in cell wall biosynthesis